MMMNKEEENKVVVEDGDELKMCPENVNSNAHYRHVLLEGWWGDQDASP